MDELTAPRRSMYPSQQQIQHQPRDPSEISLAEYAIAMGIDVPQLTLYTRVANDLEAWMKQSKVVFEQAEEEATKMTPELFVEYSRADEGGQQELKVILICFVFRVRLLIVDLQHQLKLIRTNTRGQAKSDWYDWKLQWIEGLRVPAQKAFADLENVGLFPLNRCVCIDLVTIAGCQSSRKCQSKMRRSSSVPGEGIRRGDARTREGTGRSCCC